MAREQRSDAHSQRAPGADSQQILGRRDVAIVPWCVNAVGAVTIAASVALRGGPDDRTLAGLGIAAAVLSILLAVGNNTPFGERFRRTLGVYLLFGAATLAVLSGLALRDDGVATPFFAANVLLAGYFGLIAQARWRWPVLVALLVTTFVLQAIHPVDDLADIVIVGSLIFAGWGIGCLANEAHARTVRLAGALASFDQLTRMLNRRGFLAQLDARLAAGVDGGAGAAVGGGRSQMPDASAGADPLAVLIVDLDGFKPINDRLGHAAGDELLAWVGRRLPDALPSDAEVGRLGGDEFAVLLPSATAKEASAVAERVVRSLAERIGASAGVVTAEDAAVDADTLLALADGALYTCKADPALHVAVVAAMRVDGPAPSGSAPVKPLSYARLRRRDSWPQPQAGGIAYGWMLSWAIGIIAASGVFVVANTLLHGGDGIWTDLMRYLGVPWVLWFVVVSIAARRGPTSGVGLMNDADRHLWIVFLAATFMLGCGLAVAMLADDGLTSPLAAALFAKVLSDAAIFPRTKALVSLGWTSLCWLFVVAFTPPDTLWLVPFQGAMLISAYVLGSLGYRAFNDLTDQLLDGARTDALTGLRNRLGFERSVEQALLDAAEAGQPLTMLVADLDGFKAVNDTLGHAAGDRLLVAVAAALRDVLPPAATIARLGGDEFAAVVPGEGGARGPALADAVSAALAGVAAGSVGSASFPEDGRTIDALSHVADARSYARKRGDTRRAEPTRARPAVTRVTQRPLTGHNVTRVTGGPAPS